MSEPIKFPDMRPRTPSPPINIPPPSSFRLRVPDYPTSEQGDAPRRIERRRRVLWFGVAVALHAALLLGIWLTPRLRIKWEPSPDAWVHVTSLPAEPAAPALPAEHQAAAPPP